MSSKPHAFSLGCAAAMLSWSAQAAVVTLDFEAIGLAAPSTGTAVGTTFLSAGLTFSANAMAFHNGQLSGNDTQTQIPSRSGNFGYVRSQMDRFGDFSDFTISVTGKNYINFSLNIAAPAVASQILAYDAQNTLLNTSLSDFANGNGWAWTTTPFELVGSKNKKTIDRISFITGKNGFAIDDLRFTEAAGGGGGGGNVPEPAVLGLVALALAAAGVASRRGKSA